MKTIGSIKDWVLQCVSSLKDWIQVATRWAKEHRSLWYYLVTILIGLFTIVVILYYIFFPSRGYFHADSTDTLMWAESFIDARWIYNTDFAYAAYFLFGGSLLMMPFIGIFGVSMLAHVLGMGLFYLIFYAAILFFCRSMKVSWMWSVLIGFVISFGVASGEKIREIFYGHVIYYSLGILFVLIGLGLLFRMEEKLQLWIEEKKKSKLILYLILGPLFFLLASINGIQSITIFVVPVLGAFVIERLLDGSKPLFAKENTPGIIASGLVLIGSIIGIFFYSLLAKEVSQGYADAYSVFSAPHEWILNINRLLEHWFTLIGVDVVYGDPIKSIEGLFNLIRILFGFIIVFIPFTAVINYSKLPNSKVRVVIITHWILSSLIILGYIFGLLSSASWRLSPILASSIIASVVYLHSLFQQVNTKRFAILFMMPLVLFGMVTSYIIIKMPHDYNLENGHSDGYYLARELEKLDLTYGYATFWRANLITVVSDSKVKVRSITADYEIYHFQSQLSWYQEQEGVDRYFVLLNHSEYRNVYTAPWFELEHTKVVLYGPQTYYVLIFSQNIFYRGES